MKANNIGLLLLLLVAQNIAGQNQPEQLLHFRVVSDSTSVEGINVVNLVNEKAAVTDVHGNFSIPAKVDDLLVLTAVNFEYKRKIIEEEDLKQQVILIRMIPKITQLDEVIISQHPDITSESLGIVPKGQKLLTPAERRLYTAKSGPVDIIANKISGRTKRLKKELEVSRKETLLEKVAYLYEDKYYIETLNIAPEYVKGFQYYLIEDPEFVAALKARNKTMTMFLASELAVRYNQLTNGK
ncbi:MAG TPA: hypothetical protein VF676_05465 [Flavobacterium sp.]